MSEQTIQASAAVSSTEDVIELPEDKLVKRFLEEVKKAAQNEQQQNS